MLLGCAGSGCNMGVPSALCQSGPGLARQRDTLLGALRTCDGKCSCHPCDLNCRRCNTMRCVAYFCPTASHEQLTFCFTMSPHRR